MLPTSPPTSGWSQRGSDIDGEAAGDHSGYSASLSGDGLTLAVEARNNDGINGSDSGHVRVYTWNGSSWVQKGSDIDGEAAGDQYQSGFSVSLSVDGLTVAIGAHRNDGINGSNSGHVRVYTWNVSTSVWVQKGSDIDGEAAGDESGFSVSLSDDGLTVAIGALYNGGNAGHGSYSGHVRVYTWNVSASAWVQKGSDIDGEAHDQSGFSVSLSVDGLTVAIGAPGAFGSYSGHVRVYTWNVSTSVWVQKGSDIDGEAAGDNSGWSVSLSDDGLIVAIGALFNDGNGVDSGHVRVYTWNGSSWVQKGSDIDGEAGNDLSGFSVSLSGNGLTVAIGAHRNDGINGSDSGHVRVYTWNVSTSAWVQKGSDIEGEAAGDYSGRSVSLSDDGLIVAIGAIYNDGNGADSGHVRVFSWV
jgi:hypothetical protein